MRIERHRSSCSILLSLIVLAGCEGRAPQSQTTSTSKPSVIPSTPSPKTPLPPADVSVSMMQLHADLVTGVDAMRAKFGGQQIELSGGTIVGFGSKPTADDPTKYVDTVNIWERVSGAEFGVECEMAEPRPWMRLAPGQSIRVQGMGQTKDEPYQPESRKIQLTLKHAELLNSMPLNRPVQSVTAEELVRQFKKNPQGTKDKYHGKPLIVEGNLESVGKPLIDDSQPFLLLKSPVPEIAVKCSSGVTHSHPYWVEIQNRPIGTPIKLFVESAEVLIGEKQISLFNVFEMKEELPNP